MKKKLWLLALLSVLLVGCEKKEILPEPISGNLKIWTTEEEPFWSALGQEFASAMGTKDLDIQITVFDSSEELQNFFLNALAEGRGPDVINTQADFLFSNRKKLIPLQQDMGLSVQKFQNEFVPSAGEAFIEGEKIWGVPLAVDTLALIFNQDLVSGIYDSLDSRLLTWEELKKGIPDVTKKDNSFERFARSGIALGRVDNIRWGDEILLDMIFQMGGKLFSDDGTESILTQSGVTSEGKKKYFIEEAVQSFLEFSSSESPLFSWNEFLSQSDSVEKNLDTFLDGKVAFIFAFSRDIPLLKQSILDRISRNEAVLSENQIGVTFFPQSEEGEERKILAKIDGLAVARSTKDADLSWSFLKFALRKENLRALYRTTGIPSAMVDLLLEQEVATEVFVRQAKFAHFLSFPLSQREILEGLKELISDIQNKNIAIQEGLTRLENQFTQKLQRLFLLQKEI